MSEDCKLIIPYGERFAICLNSVCNVISSTTEMIMMVTHIHTQIAVRYIDMITLYLKMHSKNAILFRTLRIPLRQDEMDP